MSRFPLSAPSAACRDMDPDLFYLENAGVYPPEVQVACASCPLRLECRAWAVDNENYGYWGGTTPGQRRAIRARRAAHDVITVSAAGEAYERTAAAS